MNSLIERWIQSFRHELLDRTLIWNQAHPLRVLREYEQFHNEYRPHRGPGNARPLRPLPEPTTNPAELTQLRIHRRDRQPREADSVFPGADRYRCTVNPADLRSLQEGDLNTREESLHRLIDRAGGVGDESAAQALRTLVRDYSDYHRSLYTRAMNHVAVFGDATLKAPLLAALADTRYNCQAWAAMGCVALGIHAAVPGLLTLVDHPQWMAREQAVIGLGELGDESVVEVLAPLLHDPADWMRQRAADALGKIRGDAALAALWAELEHRRFPRIGYIASALALFTPEIIPRLCRAAASDDPDTRYWAAVALGSTGDDRAVATLQRLMAEDQGATVFDGRVSVAAKKGLRTLRRIQAAIASREQRPVAGS